MTTPTATLDPGPPRFARTRAPLTRDQLITALALVRVGGGSVHHAPHGLYYDVWTHLPPALFPPRLFRAMEGLGLTTENPAGRVTLTDLGRAFYREALTHPPLAA